MRIVPTNCVSGEAYLAKHIYNETGNILLKKGTKLTDTLLKRIEENLIYTIYIDDEYSIGEIQELVRPELKVKAIQALKETFTFIEKSFAHDKKIDLGLKKQLNLKSMEKYITGLKAVSEMIIEEISSNHQLMINLVDIKNLNNHTYEHSLNVAVLSLVVGIEMKFSSKELSQLFLGALLHDVGKTLLPKDLVNKSDPYTDEEEHIMKAHPFLGYEYLKDNFSFTNGCKLSVLQHHERFDGTGYPKGIPGSVIHRYAKIVAVADTYDNMTSDTPQKRAFPPNEALEYIMGAGDSHFDHEISTIFSRKIVPYPEGTLVRLSNESYAIVTGVNINYPMRPIVKILEKNVPREQLKTIDLMKDTNLTILNIQYAVPQQLAEHK